MSHPLSPSAATLALGLLSSVGLAACAEPSTVGSRDEALTAAQCSYFASGDKVTICHHTGAARRPYSIIRTSVASCGGHADHEGDYVASSDPASPLYDPTCNGQGCLPEGAPADGTIECCAGLANVGGTCAATSLQIVDIEVRTPTRTWRATGGCDGASKLFVEDYGTGTLLNLGAHQGLSTPLEPGRTASYLFHGTGYEGGQGTIEVTLSDGHTLTATGDTYGNAPAPAVTIGDRSYQITLFESLSHGDDAYTCDAAGQDQLPDLLGDLNVEVFAAAP